MNLLKTTDSLIFDVDGTLWDSCALVAEAWNTVLKKLPFPRVVNTELLHTLFGKQMIEIFGSIFPDLPRDMLPGIAERCYQAQSEALKTGCGDIYPGVKETIPLLSRNFPLYIVSNCQKGYIEDFLRASGLSPYFQGHLCYGDTGEPKGHTIQALMKQYSLSHAVYIGDIRGDALAAKEAGIPFIWASYGFGDVEPELCAEKIKAFPELSNLFLI